MIGLKEGYSFYYTVLSQLKCDQWISAFSSMSVRTAFVLILRLCHGLVLNYSYFSRRK